MIFPSQSQRAADFKVMGAPSDIMELIAITRWIWHEDQKKHPEDSDYDYPKIKRAYIERIIPIIETTERFVEEDAEHRLTLNRLITSSSLAVEFSPDYAAKHFLPIKLKGIPDDWKGAGPHY